MKHKGAEIALLRAQVAQLQREVKALQARPVFQPYPYWPSPWTTYPWAVSSGNVSNIGTVTTAAYNSLTGNTVANMGQL